MQKSNIEYLTHSWNFYTGCNHWKTGVCPVGEKCWAKGMANRFGRSFEPTLHPEKLLEPLSLKKPARIGVCFTGDLFGDWVEPDKAVDYNIGYPHKELKYWVFKILEQCPQHQFFFLTKNPEGYQKWGKFPDNAWLGATVCNDKMLDVAGDKMEDIQAKHRWLSFEPLMKRLTLSLDYALYYGGISWVVIGGWSGGKQMPKAEWVLEIVEACDKANIPVWLKNNLKPLLLDYADDNRLVTHYNHGESEFDGLELFLRQELPKQEK